MPELGPPRQGSPRRQVQQVRHWRAGLMPSPLQERVGEHQTRQITHVHMTMAVSLSAGRPTRRLRVCSLQVSWQIQLDDDVAVGNRPGYLTQTVQAIHLWLEK